MRPRYDWVVSGSQAIVRLTEPDCAGSYLVVEKRADGSLVLQPETVEAVVEAFADRILDENEQDEMFARLDVAADCAADAGR